MFQPGKGMYKVAGSAQAVAFGCTVPLCWCNLAVLAFKKTVKQMENND